MFLGSSERLDKLANVSLFNGFSKNELRQIDKRAKQVEARPGQVLAREGEPGREFMLIIEGKARVERGGKTIARLRDADFFGELSLIDGQPRNASVVADSPISLLVVTKQAFGELMKSSPSLQKKVMAGLISRLREANKKLAALN
jgi:CRP/FNR family transcriptional regulator/CRP/FNR family cyclic AMP-dependent transcriptional regulator